MKHRFSLPIFLLNVLLFAMFLSACVPSLVKYPEPLKEKRPSLMYPPGPQLLASPKYPLKVGVMTAGDKRSVRFWHDADSFFAEEATKGVSEAMGRDLDRSGIFNEVVRIDEQPPAMLTAEVLQRLKDQYGVEMVLIPYLTEFCMPREKSGNSLYLNTYIVKVRFGMTAQLVYLDNGIVVWADTVNRMQEDLADEGVLAPEKMGELARGVIKDGVQDMKTLLIQTGKAMKVRR